jgi:hypothetical protein
MMPSTSPGSWPLSFSACWTFLTSSLPAELLRLVEDISEEDEPDDVEDMPVSVDALPDLEAEVPVSLDALPDFPLWLVRLLPLDDPLVPL